MKISEIQKHFKEVNIRHSGNYHYNKKAVKFTFYGGWKIFLIQEHTKHAGWENVDYHVESYNYSETKKMNMANLNTDIKKMYDDFAMYAIESIKNNNEFDVEENCLNIVFEEEI